MSVKLMSKAWEMDIPTGQKFVLLALCDHANDDGLCYPSQGKIASKCSLSPRAVVGHIKWLEDHGILEKSRRQKGGNRQSNIYEINLENYKSHSANSAHAESAHADSALTNVQITTSQCANSAPSYKEEPSVNHQYNHHSIAASSAIAANDVNLPVVEDKKISKARTANPDNVKTWEAYSQAYISRYGVEPVRNAKVNGQIANIVKSVGAEQAPALAAYFVSHNDFFFVQRRHDIGLLQSNLQKVVTDMRIGKQMTAQQARQIEQTQSNTESHKGALDMLRAKGLA